MFSYSLIDRNAEIRTDTTLILDALNSDQSRMLIWFEGELLTHNNSPKYFEAVEVIKLKKDLSEPVYLGKHESTWYFSCQLNRWHEDLGSFELKNLRSASRLVDDYHLGLLFYSQGVLNWHRNHAFCSNCGSDTTIINAGHTRQCNNSDCGKMHYPKIDPAVIFSIINSSGPQSKILLGRQSSWDENRYSVIAGFVEHGETLEDAVRREAYEETSMKVEKVSYVASQPWPFPDSLMIGFECETNQNDIVLIDKELEKASWFSAGDIEQQVKSGELKMPFSVSISWHLIDRWFRKQKGYPLNFLEKD